MQTEGDKVSLLCPDRLDQLSPQTTAAGSLGKPTCFSSERLLQPHTLDLGGPLPLLHLLQLPLDGL